VFSLGPDGQHAKDAADIIQAFTGDGTHVWCAKRGSAQHRRFHTLATLRRMLVLSRQEPGPAGLLSNTAAVQALQELLPFATLLDFATAGSGLSHSDGEREVPIMDRLLPPVRAWLLADAAAGILLPGDDNR
jgi:hypothetical protein